MPRDTPEPILPGDRVTVRYHTKTDWHVTTGVLASIEGNRALIRTANGTLKEVSAGALMYEPSEAEIYDRAAVLQALAIGKTLDQRERVPAPDVGELLWVKQRKQMENGLWM
jgi:hypothetical protein